MSSNSNTLVDEKIAISLFLDSLLSETEEVTALETPIVVEITPQIVDIPSIEIKTEVKIDTPDITSPVTESIQSTEIELKIEETEEILPVSVVPEWANEPFQILLFEVAGLKLAVPLVELSSVIKWDDSVTEMPGSADFYLGILQHLDYKSAVIDTAKMVLPAKKQSELINDDARERVKHIVLIDNYRWGLACDKIGDVITLQPEEVRWRGSNSKRAWLAGTVIDHMCALLNSKAFAEMLDKGQSDDDLA